MTNGIHNISIIGDGAWGTTLAVYLAEKGHVIRLWGAFPKYVQRVQKNRYNDKFLPGIRIPDNVTMVEKLDAAIKETDIVVLAFPSKFAGTVLKKIAKTDLKGKIIVSVTVGTVSKAGSSWLSSPAAGWVGQFVRQRLRSSLPPEEARKPMSSLRILRAPITTAHSRSQ